MFIPVTASNRVMKFIALNNRKMAMNVLEAIDISIRSSFSVENPVVEMVDMEMHTESMTSLPSIASITARIPVSMVYTAMKLRARFLMERFELETVLFRPSDTNRFLLLRLKNFNIRQNTMMNPIPPAQPVVALQTSMDGGSSATLVTMDIPVVVNPLMDSNIASGVLNP